MDFTINGIIVSGSKTVTVDDSRKLFPGLFVRSSATKPCTKIDSITDTTTIEITENGIINYTGDIIFTDMSPYKSDLQCESLKEIQDIVDQEGQFIKIIVRNESDITRDDYNSFKSKSSSTTYYFKAYPVEYNNSTQRKDQYGFKEDLDVTVHLAMKDWIDKDLDFKAIDMIRTTVIVNSKKYSIADFKPYAYLGSNYGYLILGLKKVS